MLPATVRRNPNLRNGNLVWANLDRYSNKFNRKPSLSAGGFSFVLKLWMVTLSHVVGVVDGRLCFLLWDAMD